MSGSHGNQNSISSCSTIILNYTPNSPMRRTLSADMSSPKWVQHYPLTRVQSSEQLQALGEGDHGDDDVDRSHDNKDATNNRLAFEDILSSILSQNKAKGFGSGSGSGSGQPYVPPKVKQSASSLGGKSLEICTESLGSETGSDGFSSHSVSEPDKDPEEPEQQVAEQENYKASDVDDVTTAVANKYSVNYAPNKRVSYSPRSFPPPLPSLGPHHGGSNLHMRSHRQDGRLVLEAVSVPSQNCFRAQRHDGRLLLTLTSTDEIADTAAEHGGEIDPLEEILDDDDNNDIDKEEIDDEILDDEGDNDEEDDIEEEIAAIVMEETSSLPNKSPSALIMKTTTTTTTKFISGRSKTSWPRNFNPTVISKTFVEQDDDDSPMAKSLPPRPRMARILSGTPSTTAALNVYEYYWRRSEAAAAMAVLKPLGGLQQKYINNVVDGPHNEKKKNNNIVFAAHNRKSWSGGQKQEVVVVKAGAGGFGKNGEKAEDILRGCKESRRSLLFFEEPYCVATS